MNLQQILFPHYLSQVSRVIANSGSFVHYTSSDVAVSIIKNKQVWMRNATLMNDYKEIEYGIECIEEALKSSVGLRFSVALNSIEPGLFGVIREFHDKVMPVIKKQTYLLCISEHLKEEDETGRLSMWRAYGGSNGIALVLNRQAFFQASDALAAYTSPVAYLSVPEFISSFDKVVTNIEANLAYLKSCGSAMVMPLIYRMIQFAILCTKHPGFREEREWRVVSSPAFGTKGTLTKSVEVVRGVPQIVTKLNLQNSPADNLHHMEIPELLEKVIIGPTNHPYETAEAIASLLYDSGVKYPLGLIVTSDIPLRQS